MTTLLGAAFIACPLSVVLCCDQNAKAQQPDSQKPPARDEQGRPARGRGLLAEMTAFKTDVPAHPFDIVLARPTRDSMTVSVVYYEKDACEGYVEYRRDDSAHLDRCPTQPLPTGETALFTLEHLSPETAYVYRFKYRKVPTNNAPGAKPEPQEAEAFSSSEYYTFHTPRVPGDTFTFTIQADSHLDASVTPAMYSQTLANALADRPDFHIDLGDTFMTDKRGREFKETLPHYVAQRYYFGQLCHSAPLFMVLGNHDGEVGYASEGPDSMAAWSFTQRTKYFPTPEITDNADGKAMYSGRTSCAKGQGANYYEFTWGDAQFIVLDPFWFTTNRPRGGGGGGPGGGREKKEADVAGTDENWARTLGKDQYDWLTRTLEGSKAKYKFVLIHHLVGGLGKANRGGVESSFFFEWGGKNADGSAGFADHRPGWAMPIHDLLVKHRVSAVFHGHDHLYVRSERDGLVYQCVPQPGNVAGGTRSAAEYGYKSGMIFGSPGYLRVRIGAEQARVEFVRSAVANAGEPGNRRGDPRNAEVNGTVMHTYSISPPIGK
ncbi:MAG: metallophosphoesterase [Phycisphaerales bacterium]|nr:metallophosphoesterase [Phycisphaerales bacterium]